jgi:hypothetical protein
MGKVQGLPRAATPASGAESLTLLEPIHSRAISCTRRPANHRAQQRYLALSFGLPPVLVRMCAGHPAKLTPPALRPVRLQSRKGPCRSRRRASSTRNGG